MTDDHLSARTRRRLAHSPYAPFGVGENNVTVSHIVPEDDDVAQLRDDVLARLLVERLASLGAMTETEAVDVLDIRAPGRGRAVVKYALRCALVRRVHNGDEPATLEALGAPRALAA